MAPRDIMNPAIQVNPALRAVRFGNAVTAALFGSWDKNDGMFGNGDCLLMDGRRRVFALSDASERFPQASRRLLQAVATGTHTVPWPECLQSAWCSQPYVQKATFVGVQIRMDPRPEAIVVTGGDSLVYIYDANTGDILYRNSVDMHFVGRMSTPPHPIHVPLPPHSRILLASDGFSDLVDPNDKAKRLVQPCHIDDVESWLSWLHDGVQRLRNAAFLHDDIAVMTIDPFAWRQTDPPNVLLLGGTSAVEEERFVSASLPPKWISLDRTTGLGYLETMGGSLISPS